LLWFEKEGELGKEDGTMRCVEKRCVGQMNLEKVSFTPLMPGGWRSCQNNSM